MEKNSPHIDAGNALEPVVYQRIEKDFGHRVRYKGRQITWTRAGKAFPILSRYIDGMVRWKGVPQLLEIKTTSSRNFNFVLQSIREGKTCKSLDDYRDQMKTYGAMIWENRFDASAQDLPADLTIETGVLAILNRDTMELRMMQLDLFPGGRVPEDILDGPMLELEEKHGVAYWQLERKEQEATTRRADSTMQKTPRPWDNRRFAPKFGRRYGGRKTTTLKERQQ